VLDTDVFSDSFGMVVSCLLHVVFGCCVIEGSNAFDVGLRGLKVFGALKGKWVHLVSSIHGRIHARIHSSNVGGTLSPEHGANRVHPRVTATVCCEHLCPLRWQWLSGQLRSTVHVALCKSRVGHRMFAVLFDQVATATSIHRRVIPTDNHHCRQNSIGIVDRVPALASEGLDHNARSSASQPAKDCKERGTEGLRSNMYSLTTNR